MASLVKTDKISTTAGGAQEFTIPAADGTANQHLKTDGSGVLGWASPPSANPLTLTGSTNTWIPTITGADALTGTANFTYDGNILDVKNSGTASSIKLYCESSNAHYQAIKAAPHAGASDWTLTLPPTVPSVSGQALTATTAGVSSWTTLPAQGLKNASIWRVTSDFTGNTNPITNWEEADTDGAGRVGDAMSVSTGVFTFPNTGLWEIIYVWQGRSSGTSTYNYAFIDTSVNSGSNYYTAARSSQSQSGGSADASSICHFIFDVTNTSTHKVTFGITLQTTGGTTQGDTDHNMTHVVFKQLGDT